MSVGCAACGRIVATDDDYVAIEVTWKRMRYRDEHDDHFMHERCAQNVLGSWEAP